MKKRIFYSTLAAILILPALGLAEGEEGDRIKTLDEVVVTATRTAQEIKTVPANVTIITADQIVESGASSIVDLLEKQANIHFRTFSGNASQAQIDLRGFGENGFGRTLIMLDGRRLNRLDMSSIDWTQIPLEQIERIEVVRGSASVLYGDAAIAGVIHVITKKGELEPVISGGLQIGEDNFHNLSASVMGAKDKFTFSAYGANQQTDGWRDRTAFQSYGGGFQLGYDISNNLSVSGGASYNKTDFQLPGTLTKSELAEDRTQAQPGHTDDESENEYRKANLVLEGALGNWGDIDVNFIYGEDEINSTIPSWFNFNNSDLELNGIQPKYILETQHKNFANKLITGVDIYHQTFTVDRYGELARLNKTNNTKLKRDTVGWYVRDEISIGGNYMFSGGFRIEKAETHGRSVNLVTSTVIFDDKKEHKGKPFELSATWLPRDDIKFYTRYSTVYRYPFIDEQASYYGFVTDSFLVDLEAEKGKSFDVGFNIKPVDELSIGINLFQIDMEDEISWNGSTFRNENLDDTRHRGLEMSLQYGMAKVFDLSFDYSYRKATFEAGPNSGKEVPLVPNNLFSANLDLFLPYSFDLVTMVRFADDSYLSGDIDNNTEKLPDYTVVDILLRYKRNFGESQLTAFLKVNNLFDKEYSTIGTDNQWWGGENTYYPSPGRKFYGGIVIRF